MFLYLPRSLTQFRNVRCVFFSFPETSNYSWTFSPPLKCKTRSITGISRRGKVYESNTSSAELASSSAFQKNSGLTCQKFWGAASCGAEPRERANSCPAELLWRGRRAPNTRWHVTHTLNLFPVKKVSSSFLSLRPWVKDLIKQIKANKKWES